ncbi:MAG: hypothetical protein FJX76_22625 [Armatimonadetes bacterium]|nr:hypothetical protein [Armatimonadota bacterium]
MPKKPAAERPARKRASKKASLQAPRVLTFNWNETYTALLARVFPGMHVIDRPSMDENERAWDMRVCGVPDGVRVLHDPRAAREAILRGDYDVVICHTIRDVEYVKPLPVASVLMAHTTLDAELFDDPDRVPIVREFLRQLLTARGILFACPSAMKLTSWGLEGDVIPHAVDASAHGGWVGDREHLLAVGTDLKRWAHATGYEHLKRGLENVPWTLLGNNAPDESPGHQLQPLVSPLHTAEQYRHARAFVSAQVAPFEDAISLPMLQAMAYGAPVLMLAHPDNPLEHERNGLVAQDEADLGRQARRLLEDVALARRLGAAGHDLVQEHFGFERFRDSWQDIVARARAHWDRHRVRVEEADRAAQSHLARGMEALRAGAMGEAEDAFIEAAALAPDSPGPYCNLGAFYLNQRRFEEARAFLERSLFTDPYFQPALLNMARLNLIERVPQAAAPLLEAAVTVDPTDFSAGSLLALAYLEMKEHQRARHLLVELESRDAPPELVVPLLAQAYRENQEYARAADAARRWVAFDAENPDAHHELSQSLLLQGDLAAAERAPTRSLELRGEV